MRKCRYCKAEIPKTKDCKEPVQKAGFCSIDHMAKHGIEKAKLNKEKKEKAQHKAAKEAIKTPSKWKAEAQKEFNRFIRLRDYRDDCISCYTPTEEIQKKDGWKPGGCWDAGHYKTRGAFPELRFEENNVHKQCKSCNASQKYSAKRAESVSTIYKEKLIIKIGKSELDWIEGPHDPKKYTIEELKQIKNTYRKKANELAKELGI